MKVKGSPSGELLDDPWLTLYWEGLGAILGQTQKFTQRKQKNCGQGCSQLLLISFKEETYDHQPQFISDKLAQGFEISKR
jgi:hypothetical protein